MKNYFILAMLILFSQYSSGQAKGSAVLYGYIQEVLPGVNHNVIMEGGEEVASPHNPKRNYRIYIESSSRIYPVEMWIKGERYSAGMDIINKTPVVFGSDSAGNRKVLVPHTTGKLLLLTPTPFIEVKNAGDVSSIAKSNELVVLYRQNGKFYYNALAKLEYLQAAAMQ